MTTNDPTPKGTSSQGEDKHRFNLEHVDLDFSFNPLAQDIHVYETKVAQIGGHWVEIDSDNTTKLFTSPAGTFHHVMKLKPKAKALLLWILYRIDHGTDIIMISHDRVAKDYEISPNTLRGAIAELIEAKIIARVADSGRSTPETEEGDYWRFWINPHVMFKGSRYSFYRRNAILNPESPIPASQQSEKFPRPL